jgi:hypothetical protein
MPSIPPDPFTMMAEAATALHTLFTSYLAAGFTADQALRLIAYTMAAQAAQGNQPPEQQ